MVSLSRIGVLEHHNNQTRSTKANSRIRTHSEDSPMFHDLSSGQLVKLENFSFDDTPNHFDEQSIRVPLKKNCENEGIGQKGDITATITQGRNLRVRI